MTSHLFALTRIPLGFHWKALVVALTIHSGASSYNRGYSDSHLAAWASLLAWMEQVSGMVPASPTDLMLVMVMTLAMVSMVMPTLM